jgi:hypothetical protein
MLRFRRQLHHAPHPGRPAGRARAHGHAQQRAKCSWVELGGLANGHRRRGRGVGGTRVHRTAEQAASERARGHLSHGRVQGQHRPTRPERFTDLESRPAGGGDCRRTPCASASRLAVSSRDRLAPIWPWKGRRECDASERVGGRRRSWKRILACGRVLSIWTGAVGGRVDGALT